jgi:hypothetical protein
MIIMCDNVKVLYDDMNDKIILERGVIYMRLENNETRGSILNYLEYSEKIKEIEDLMKKHKISKKRKYVIDLENLLDIDLIELFYESYYNLRFYKWKKNESSNKIIERYLSLERIASEYIMESKSEIKRGWSKEDGVPKNKSIN